MVQLSDMVQTIHPSLTRKLFNMAKEYHNVIDFTLGDPDLPTPENVRLAGCKAIMEGKTRYSHNAGIVPLREAICKDVQRETCLQFDPLTEVIVTVGGMEAIFLTLLSILNPGDEVIIPAPYWINNMQMVQMCGGKPVIVDSYEENDFVISVKDVKNAVSSHTKAMILNSPNNPTGVVFDVNTMQGLAEIIVDSNLFVISDEVYKNIIYDNVVFRSIITFDGMRERTALINSFSKKFCMTGWRIGYVIAPAVLISNMIKLQENIVACAPLPSQYAAIEALEGGEAYTSHIVKEFKNRRDILLKGISRIDKLSCKAPQGTFYAFVNIKKTGFDSEAFAYALLEKEQVAVVPGITYGKCSEGYIRLAYTLTSDKIEEGIGRIARFVNDI